MLVSWFNLFHRNLFIEFLDDYRKGEDVRIIDKLNKFAEILLTCSLDGINDYNAYELNKQDLIQGRSKLSTKHLLSLFDITGFLDHR